MYIKCFSTPYQFAPNDRLDVIDNGDDHPLVLKLFVALVFQLLIDGILRITEKTKKYTIKKKFHMLKGSNFQRFSLRDVLF